MAMLGILLSLAGTAFAQSEAPVPMFQGKRQLVIWGISIGADSKGQSAVIREFERQNPDIKVRILSMGAGQMDPQKLMTSIVGNVAPDVINQDRFTISDWASRGAFRALDDFIQRDQSVDPNTPTEDKFYAAPWEEATYDGRIYAIPTGADNRILYINRARFRERARELRAAGLDPEGAPKTWSELLAYSKVLTEKNPDGSLKRAGFLPNFGNSWLYMYCFMNNANFMGADARTCTMATPESAEALDFMKQGYEIVGGYEKAKSFESGFLGKENDAFIIGKVAMKIDGDWILNSLSLYAPRLDLDVAPPPVPDDRYYRKGRFANEKDTFVTWFGGFSLAIPRGAKNVADAWRYIKFATSKEGILIENEAQRDWERRRGRTYIPRNIANKEANEAVFAKFKPADRKFANALALHIELGKYGRVRPSTFVGQTLWSEHVKAMEVALYGKASALDALKEGQKAVQRELDAFYSKEAYPVLDLGIPTWIAVGLIVAGLGFAGYRLSRLKLGRLARQEAFWAYVFVAPWLIGFLVLTLGPMVASLFFSFTQYDVLNEARWVGIRNYQELFSTDRASVFKAFGNAAYMAAVGVPLGLATGLAVAMLLNVSTRGMRFYRTLFYMPAIVPIVASAVLWTWVLTPDPSKGLINSFWQITLTDWLEVPPPAWLNSADWAKNALILQGLWGAGSGMLLWLAGLKGVPNSLYEAAGLDGANPRQQFWKVTFPMLSPVVFFNAVMGFIGAMQEFDRQYVMKPNKDGPIGPDDSLLTPVYHLFRNGFAFFKMGYASSLAWLIFAVILILTFTQWQLAPRWVHYETDK
jgi:multiple sugar transport system permease protein